MPNCDHFCYFIVKMYAGIEADNTKLYVCGHRKFMIWYVLCAKASRSYTVLNLMLNLL